MRVYARRRGDSGRGVSWRGVSWRGVSWRGVSWRGDSWVNLSALLLIAAGVVIAVTGHATLRRTPPPVPPARAARPDPPQLSFEQIRHRRPASAPVHLDIPAIKVRARIGGAAVIAGHVDAAGVGPAVFYYLGDMRAGNRIYVHLRSGRRAIFEVYSVALYQKDDFPTARVYGYTSWPTLRLVTCGGVDDPRSGHYLGSTVVFATYVGQRAAKKAGQARPPG